MVFVVRCQFGILSLLFFGLTCLAIAPAAMGDEADASGSSLHWPRLLGENFDGDAVTDQTFDWSEKPRFLWSLEVGEGYGLGSVWGDEYFQFDAGSSSSGPTERLRCIDLNTGKVKWQDARPLEYRDMYGYESGPRSTPTLDSQSVFTLGVAGELVCRDRRTHQVRWAVDTNEKYGVVQNFFGVGSSPLLVDDLVIVMVGGSPSEDASIAPGRLDRVSPNGSALVAFDKATGKERWKCGDDLASYSSPRTIEIDGHTRVLVYARDNLLCVDPKLGKVLWKYPHRADILESAIAMTPVVDANQVFLSECYQIGSVLLNVTDQQAKEVWKDPPFDRRSQAMRSHWATPVLIDGFLYGCSGRNAPDSDFRCVKWDTGEVQWTDSRRTRSSATRVGNVMLVLEERGTLQVVKANPEKFELISEWRLDQGDGDVPAIRYPCWSAPIVVGNRMLVRGDERVVCFECR
ncbi:Pyrrolo-quinoline quinone [Rhodopirellula maiorica SM1]|uniref:Pyrrolo-quinoline quinone n=1 Tax=Rhodopirellula maiorica SM1 TaxID=1265738 RepID=M5REL9_9BACT|nr:PQQ-binding-like beta-propeller repeat protein [Rhodopirellula maiorica]EMI17805.1 Pyrrolo-quinoline quinone [Rhodopirellula maiorica SM1]